ncbi:MAG: 3-hydroxyacyl-CoA dehydrogenase NAD-binding domain-containing protein [Bacteroidia bacterium]|nr:3-hydroxyacyl-CoA dehydrogenase NAD-binding domain-containing protein [Bacteroidia bacterium]
MEINKIAVIGGGIMGRGIALTTARAGISTILFDINDEMLDVSRSYFEKFLSKSVEKGKMSEEEKHLCMERIYYTTDNKELIADLIIEAVPENVELKQKVLGPIEFQNNPDTIIASNTSTIPITRIAAGLKRPERVVGMHFFNPAPLMKLVEVISGESTAPEVAEAVFELAGKLGKVAVKTKDEPGFIVNRVARQFYLESMRIVEEQTASVKSVDRLLKSSGFRMGPFELMDLIGIETNLSVSKSMYEAFFYEDRFRPCRIQQKKVDAGHYGRKSGQGFYSYEK